MKTTFLSFRMHLLLGGLFILFSCMTGVDKTSTLYMAESCLNEAPDSALAMLTTIHPEDLHQSREKAKYQLLMAIALDKCDSVVTDESILEFALPFYEKHHDRYNLTRTLYYLGRIQQNKGDFTTSMLSFTRAEQLVKDINNKQLEYLLYMAIADNYSRHYNSADELTYTQKALEVVKDPSLQTYIPGAEYRYAATLANNKQYNKAVAIMDSLYHLPSAMDQGLRDLCLVRSTFLKTAYHLIPADEIKCIYDSLLQSSVFMEMDDYCAYAYILGINGEAKQSKSLFKQIGEVFPEGEQAAKAWESSLAAKKGDYATAYRLQDETLSYQDSIVRYTLQQSLSRIQKEFYQTKLDDLKSDQKQQKQVSLIVFLIILLIIAILALGAYLLWQHLRTEQKESKAKIEALVSSMKSMEEANASSLNNLRRQYLSRMFRPLGVLYSDYMFHIQHGEDSSACQKRLISAFDEINIENDEGWFEKMLNKETGDLPSKLKTSFPSIKKEDYRLFCYYLAGFDATTISILMHLPSQNAVYLRKLRLRKLIQDSSNKDNMQFLSALL